MTSHYPRTGRTNHRCICKRDKHGVNHPLSGAVAYSNWLDRTTATLRLPVTDAIQVNNAQRRADNGKIIKSWQPRSCRIYTNKNNLAHVRKTDHAGTG